MKYAVLLLLAALAAGCTAVPKQQMTMVDASACRPVEGAGVRYTRQGAPIYKYICNGKGVWAAQL